MPPKHFPVLDGLRGVAIALVMLAHLTSRDLVAAVPLPFGVLEQLGQSGVDLFFVLSGFLITGILVDTREDRGRTLHFAARRVLKIVPAFYAALLFFGVLLPLVFPAGHAFSKSWLSVPLAQVTFLSNVAYFLQGRFPLEPMSVSWSLAVEAQFYLLWPFLCWRVAGPRLHKVLVGLLVAAPVLRLIAAAFGANDMQLYVLTPARLDAFAAGALVALAQRGSELPVFLRRLTSGPHAPQIVVALAGAMLVSQLAALAVPGLSPFLSAFDYSALALLYAAAVAACINPAHRVPRRFASWLERPAVRRLGRYSYGIFLTNLAVAEGLRLAGLGLEWALGDILGQLAFYPLAATACIAVGAFVYHAIEAPFLTLRRYVPRGMPTRYVERDGAPGSGNRPVSQVKDSLFLS